jgi:hypothetical protein
MMIIGGSGPFFFGRGSDTVNLAVGVNPRKRNKGIIVASATTEPPSLDAPVTTRRKNIYPTIRG